MKKVKIICTIGSSSLEETIIKNMDHPGVDLFRINLSHTHIDYLIPIAKDLKRWTQKPLCLDTEGAQLRSALLRNEIIAKEHDKIEFIPQPKLN